MFRDSQTSTLNFSLMELAEQNKNKGSVLDNKSSTELAPMFRLENLDSEMQNLRAPPSNRGGITAGRKENDQIAPMFMDLVNLDKKVYKPNFSSDKSEINGIGPSKFSNDLAPMFRQLENLLI